MNKAQAEQMLAYFRMILGVTRKLVDQFPEDRMTFKPIGTVRTVSETVVHMYAFMLEAMETVRDGKFEVSEPPVIETKSALLAYMDAQVEKFYKIFDDVTDEKLAAMIDSYGKSMPAGFFLTFAYDEHWHHRGALTVYLRMLGIEPIMIYSYEQ